MEITVFTVYDSKAKIYLDPFTARNRGVAVRSFTEAANSQGHDFCKWPEDYVLYEIGTFNVDEGVLTGDRMESLGTALQYKREDS
jgi:hypothetical protein